MKVALFIQTQMGLIDEVQAYVDPEQAKAAYLEWCEGHDVEPYSTFTGMEYDATWIQDVEVRE